MNLESKLSNEELLKLAVKNSITYLEVLIKMGYSTKSGNYKTLQKYITKYNIDISHFDPYKNRKIVNNKWTFEEIFCLNSKSVQNGNSLKSYLYKNNIRKEECQLCGLKPNEWKTGKISLILDHINGNNKDNRVENLRIVCPNCDSTLPTYMGRNRKSIPRTVNINLNKKLEKENKNEQDKQNIINKILTSNIEFVKTGWAVKLGIILNCSSRSASRYVKNYLPDFYKEKCFKHNIKNGDCSR